jgi:hypothetical protein
MKLLVDVIYNPPPSNNKIYFLDDIFAGVLSRYNDVIICGELNINLLKKTNECRRLKSFLKNYSLQYLKFDPTWHSPISHVSSLLDYIIVSNTSRAISHGQISISGISVTAQKILLMQHWLRYLGILKILTNQNFYYRHTILTGIIFLLVAT